MPMLAAQIIEESVDLVRLFPSSPIKVIKLLGYSTFNKEQDHTSRYSAAKRPFQKGWQQMDKPGLTNDESFGWLRDGGWTGLVIPKGYIVVDIDNPDEGELLYKALLKDLLDFHAIKTVRGYQFFFKDNGRVKGQDATVLMACGCVGDYRLAERGQIVLPSLNTKGREWIRLHDGELSEMPIYFERLKKLNNINRPFPVPMIEGGRNNAMYGHACRLVEFGYDQDEIHEITSFINRYFFLPPLDHSEYIATLKSALQREPSGKEYGSAPPSIAPPAVQQVIEPEHPKFNLTEMGNAERLVHRNGQNLKYCIEFEEWLLWNGSTWIEDKKRQIERIAIKTFREMYGEATKEEDMDRRTQIVKWAQSSEKSSVFLNSIARAQAMLPLSQDELNQNGYLLNCKNGVVDLKSGKLLQHDRSLLMTKNTHISYDAEASCPAWISFLQSIMKNENGEVKQDLIDFLQKAIGYTLTGDTSEQVAFFLWGTGRNGKSTFINIVKEILGDYGKQTNSDTFTSKMNDNGINNDVARLHGARFVSAVESEDGQKLSESLIKQLTGGEPITARFLRKEFFEFIPEFKIFFTTNHKPIVKGDDEGIWRRIRLIPFTYTVPKEEVDKQLPEKLRGELPGILRWAVEGCMKWQQEGLGEPEEVKAATDEYKEEMDLLSNFLDECCVVMAEAKVAVNDIHKEYMKWAEENGEYPMKQRAFSNRLQMKGFSKRKSTGNRTFFFGIGLMIDYKDKLPYSYLVTQSDSFSSIPPIGEKVETNIETGSLRVTFDSKSNSRVIEEDI
ncbi:phage/plasmid primase, P4 family [Cytobacillus solani]|uniref:phage/plasmid primase, P4 family n=1 Tax=Cytobacillus solani TaxID=1637975 RepID=UPI00207A2393|nr:phage/plasmid primase, P4 family [Cytobacillus solani]USK56359.1 phage/plasmid primase, P4 family [Cytobacillus solani]